MNNPPRPNEHLDAISRDSDCLGERRGFVCLDRNESPAPWSDEVFRDMLATLDAWDFTHYPDLGPLYDSLIRTTGLPHERLCVGAGSDAIIRRAFQAFLRPGDRVISPEPSYGMYGVWARIFQAKHIAVPYQANLKLPLESFVTSIESLKPRIVALANSDQPTGSMLSREEILPIVSACERVGAICLIDEAYHPFSPVTVLDEVIAHPCLLVARSFSKNSGIAGLRVGFAVSDKSIVQALHAVRSPGEVSSVGAKVATFLLQRPSVMENYRIAVEEGRGLLVAAANEMGFRSPQCFGNFQLLEAPPDLRPDQIVSETKRRGYLIKGGFAFSGLRNFVRVTLGGPAIMQPFVDYLRAACGELRASRGRDGLASPVLQSKSQHVGRL